MKEKINEFIYNHFISITNKLSELIRQAYSYIKSYDSKNNEQIKEKLQDINDLSVDLYSLLVDAYLLRRILDKKYINNCVVYTGAQQSANYMFFFN